MNDRVLSWRARLAGRRRGGTGRVQVGTKAGRSLDPRGGDVDRQGTTDG